MTRTTRRRVLGLLLSTAMSPLLAGLSSRGSRAQALDQGIGGTGVVPAPDSDRGIGGTGVIGTIRKFGSIIVNDMRIAYAPDATVRIDGRTASAEDLRIGQVVRVAADGPRGALSTRVIDVTSEVVGPVQSVGAKRLVVLGQTVSTAAIKSARYAVGDHVAVGGLRRNDGTIVASLIERRPVGDSRVAGPVRVAADGSLRIGGLTTTGVDPSLIDRRAHLEGHLDGDRFVATRAVGESSLLPSSLSTLSVESYVERRGGGLALGSGLVVEGTNGIDVPAGRSMRAILDTTVGPNGLGLVTMREGGRTFEAPGGRGSGRRGSEPEGGRGTGGRQPMDFGRRPGGAEGPGAGGPGGGPGMGGPGMGGPGMGGPGMGGPGMGGGPMGGPGGGLGGGRR